jgi:hypothetical protein
MSARQARSGMRSRWRVCAEEGPDEFARTPSERTAADGVDETVTRSAVMAHGLRKRSKS